MSCGIYLIRNKINNKVYIGLSVDIEERWQHYRSLYLKKDNNKDMSQQKRRVKQLIQTKVI